MCLIVVLLVAVRKGAECVLAQTPGRPALLEGIGEHITIQDRIALGTSTAATGSVAVLDLGWLEPIVSILTGLFIILYAICTLASFFRKRKVGKQEETKLELEIALLEKQLNETNGE